MTDRSFDLAAKLRTAPIWIGLTVIVALSWLYLAQMSAGMSGMSATMKMGSADFAQ